WCKSLRTRWRRPEIAWNFLRTPMRILLRIILIPSDMKHAMLSAVSAVLLWSCQIGDVTDVDRAETPNIVYILVDDMGYGDVSAHNAEGQIKTPHTDKLAEQGLRLKDAHALSSVCTPARYALRVPYRAIRLEKQTSSECASWLWQDAY